MAMSGVKLTNECQNTYQSIQKDKKFRYAIFKIADGEICLDKVRRSQKVYDAVADASLEEEQNKVR